MAKIIRFKEFKPCYERGDIYAIDALRAAFHSRTPSAAEKIAAWARQLSVEHKALGDLLLAHMRGRGHCVLQIDYIAKRLSWPTATVARHIDLMVMAHFLIDSDPTLPAPTHLCDGGERGRAFVLRMPGGWVRV